MCLSLREDTPGAAVERDRPPHMTGEREREREREREGTNGESSRGRERCPWCWRELIRQSPSPSVTNHFCSGNKERQNVKIFEYLPWECVTLAEGDAWQQWGGEGQACAVDELGFYSVVRTVRYI